MKCLLKYRWVKLPRTHLTAGKGVMGYWARLAAKAAFRRGRAKYYRYVNEVEPGTWVGGVVGLKAILGAKSRKKALEIMETLAYLGYIEYSLDPLTKKLSYKINDYVVKCTGEPCLGMETVYATDGYGFLCLPRNITERLVAGGYTFEESDAWLDLWCHTIYKDPSNIFSQTAPIVQYGRYGAVLTLETLGRRWGWEKTKVWRFLQKHGDAFTLHKLPGSFGCLIYNTQYPTGGEFSLPSSDEIVRILDGIRITGANTHFEGTDNERLNRLAAWFSASLLRKATAASAIEVGGSVGGGSADGGSADGGSTTAVRPQNRVAVSAPITRAYISPSNGGHCSHCNYDCKNRLYRALQGSSKGFRIRGPCNAP